jgi:hypothetical protein
MNCFSDWHHHAVADYRGVNRALWDERAPVPAGSPEYGLARYFEDPDFLSTVVRFDLPRLGDVSGLRGVHLQCHIGTDTVSLSRLGARMSGLDFSPALIAVARDLAAKAGADIISMSLTCTTPWRSSGEARTTSCSPG